MALPGISNANEFYSAHYLESVLSGDIKKVRERWAQEARAKAEADPTAELGTPDGAFRALRKPWQKLREAEFGISDDPAERLRLQRQLFFQPLLDALGYPFSPRSEPVLNGGEAYQIPLLAEVTTAKGEPWLWVVECFNPSDEGADPLELTIAARWACQVADITAGKVVRGMDGEPGETWEELISERVFGQEIPPRWVLAVSRDQLLLIDRQKWAASRLLRFELGTLLGENNPDALLAAATLLHREHTCPTGGGTPLLDELDENSHKHAYEVSSDLKYALRRSIELLGNEAIEWQKQQHEGVFRGKTDANALTLECLRYMYRLLFLFYVESRPDLGYAPMGSDVYRLGYSLESLRDLDTAELASEEDQASTYISDSLDRLFGMIWDGYPRRDDETAQLPLADRGDPLHDCFQLTPLKAHLFDPQRMPLLTRVRFRNVVLREVIELMSLTKAGKGKRRGRVSYSQLGINQLGAVYEALLSFRGFFAEHDLYEVQPAAKKGRAAASDDDGLDEADDDDAEGGEGHSDGAEDGDDASAQASGQEHDELEVGHFVSAEQLKAYRAEEIVQEPGTGKPKCYPKGRFIYRLAGRDREKSASYYTPESLTQCLVKYALKELLPGKSAAEILQLKVCEPAMGSAAFLNEVVNQLAQAYLERRQQETGQSIAHDSFQQELQKVKMRLADQNVFGVDLNPVAVELAEVSLWLNSIFTPENGRAFVPWFSQQLVCGNSLIGARRQIYRVKQLPTGTGRKAKPSSLWHEQAPEELAWDAPLPADGIFHFLLPDPGMAAYKDGVIKGLEPEAFERCKRWNRAFVGDPFTDSQIAHLLRLSQLVDGLWNDWAEQQRQLRLRTTDPLPVWQDPTGTSEGDWTPLKLKDRIQDQEVLGRDVANTNARLRLKWAMDYWVALWFWPISEAASLPSRDTWLLELSMILGDLEQGITLELGQGNLYADTQPKQLAANFSDRHGFVDVQKLKGEFKHLQQVEALTERIRPLHWDLEFADLLKVGGFDLVLGNPPWLVITWNIKAVLGDHNPIAVVREITPAESQVLVRQSATKDKDFKGSINALYAEISGTQSFIGSVQNYPALAGQSNNLYKCFICKSWSLQSQNAFTALIHPTGPLDDADGEIIREEIYSRLRLLFHFRNELKLFQDIQNARSFALNVYGSKKSSPRFSAIAKLFHPRTVDECFDQAGIINSWLQLEDGIKDKNGKWNTKGGTQRVIEFNKQSLSVLAELVEGSASHWRHTRMLSLFAAPLLRVIEKLSRAKTRIGDIAGFHATTGFSESEGTKNGSISRKSVFPNQPNSLVLSGSNIWCSNPLYKSARTKCSNARQYDPIDLSALVAEDFPRCAHTLLDRLSVTGFDAAINANGNSKPYLSAYRIAAPKQLDLETERSLQPAIIQPSAIHIDGLISFTVADTCELLVMCSLLCSIPYDFYVKVSGKKQLQRKPASLDTFPGHSGGHSNSAEITCSFSQFAY